MNRSKTTTDDDEIRRWAEKRGGRPRVKGTSRSKNDVGMIRIDFPGYSRQGKLEPIAWDDRLDKFRSGRTRS